MPLPLYADLFRQADERAPRIPVVAAGGADGTVIEALAQAARRGWVRPILAGNGTEIERLAAARACDLGPFRILHAIDTVAAAVAEVRAGPARILMKGQVAT